MPQIIIQDADMVIYERETLRIHDVVSSESGVTDGKMYVTVRLNGADRLSNADIAAGSFKIELIKAARDQRQLDLRAAKQFVDSVPISPRREGESTVKHLLRIVLDLIHQVGEEKRSAMAATARYTVREDTHRQEREFHRVQMEALKDRHAVRERALQDENDALRHQLAEVERTLHAVRNLIGRQVELTPDHDQEPDMEIPF